MSNVRVLPVRSGAEGLAHVEREFQRALDCEEGVPTRAPHMSALAETLTRLTDELTVRLRMVAEQPDLAPSLRGRIEAEASRLMELTKRMKDLCSAD